MTTYTQGRLDGIAEALAVAEKEFAKAKEETDLADRPGSTFSARKKIEDAIRRL